MIMRLECSTRGGDDSDEIEFLLHRDPSTPKISVASILEGFTDEPPLEENDDLFDLESKGDDWISLKIISLLLTPLCCDDTHDVTPRVSALAGCDRLEKEESEKNGSKEGSEIGSNSESSSYAASDNEVESGLESTARSEPKCKEMEDTCESGARPKPDSS
ncbi:hypothetical protein Tco_0368674 [Tanacetum coccineum]